jgi:hypothetical protein
MCGTIGVSASLQPLILFYCEDLYYQLTLRSYRSKLGNLELLQVRVYQCL